MVWIAFLMAASAFIFVIQEMEKRKIVRKKDSRIREQISIIKYS